MWNKIANRFAYNKVANQSLEFLQRDLAEVLNVSSPLYNGQWRPSSITNFERKPKKDFEKIAKLIMKNLREFKHEAGKEAFIDGQRIKFRNMTKMQESYYAQQIAHQLVAEILGNSFDVQPEVNAVSQLSNLADLQGSEEMKRFKRSISFDGSSSFEVKDSNVERALDKNLSKKLVAGFTPDRVKQAVTKAMTGCVAAQNRTNKYDPDVTSKITKSHEDEQTVKTLPNSSAAKQKKVTFNDKPEVFLVESYAAGKLRSTAGLKRPKKRSSRQKLVTEATENVLQAPVFSMAPESVYEGARSIDLNDATVTPARENRVQETILPTIAKSVAVASAVGMGAYAAYDMYVNGPRVANVLTILGVVGSLAYTTLSSPQPASSNTTSETRENRSRADVSEFDDPNIEEFRKEFAAWCAEISRNSSNSPYGWGR